MLHPAFTPPLKERGVQFLSCPPDIWWLQPSSILLRPLKEPSRWTRVLKKIHLIACSSQRSVTGPFLGSHLFPSQPSRSRPHYGNDHPLVLVAHYHREHHRMCCCLCHLCFKSSLKKQNHQGGANTPNLTHMAVDGLQMHQAR